MYKLRVKSHFDAAHYIRDYSGKCSREHGHRWEVEVCIQGKSLDKLNMLVDFVELKSAMVFVMNRDLDHYQLNESLGVDNLTAEYLAEWFYRQMEVRTIGKGIEVVEVTIWESPDCSVTYNRGES